MEVLPLTTPLLHAGSDLLSSLKAAGKFQKGDIIVVSSKAIAMCEGAAVALSSLSPSKRAEEYAKKANQDPRFAELILREVARMNGEVVGTCPYALLTALRPSGMKQGRILCPNAGVDQSNAGEGSALPWPIDPCASAKTLSKSLGIPVIISDSCCHPGRIGVVAYALVVSKISPFQSEAGKTDLFGRALRFTKEAVADQLATAANAVMGNSAQCTPAAIIRGCTFEETDHTEWVDGIEPDEDLFRGTV